MSPPDTTIRSKTVDIDAPAAFVWDVLVDYARYPEWNPYTVRVDAVLEVGADVVLHLPDPAAPGQTFTTLEHMRIIDPPHQLRYDTGDSFPGMLAVRDQWLLALGPERCSYRTEDAFSGEHAQAIYDMQAEWVTAGFDSVAEALKTRAEQLWAERSPD